MHGFISGFSTKFRREAPWSQDSKRQGKGCYLVATQDSEQVISGSWNLPLEVGGSIRFVILQGKSWKLAAEAKGCAWGCLDRNNKPSGRIVSCPPPLLLSILYPPSLLLCLLLVNLEISRQRSIVVQSSHLSITQQSRNGLTWRSGK